MTTNILPKVFLIADSTSVNYAPFLKQYVDYKFDFSGKTGEEKFIDPTVIRQDTNGGDSAMVVDYLKAAHGHIDVDLLITNAGLHDIRFMTETNGLHTSIEKYAKNIKDIIIHARKISKHVVWVTTTPFDEVLHNSIALEFQRYKKDLLEYNKVSHDVMKEEKVPVIDLFQFTLNQGEDIYEDHVHFIEPVRQKQAAYIAGWIDSFFFGKP